MSSSSSVRVTDYPAIKNAPLVGLAEGNGSFSNYHLAACIIVIPYILKAFFPILGRSYLLYLVLTAFPVTLAYWTLNSMYAGRKNEKVKLPGNNIEEYITIKDVEMKQLYYGKNKIPMQIFHDAYFDGKIEFNGV